MSTEHENTHMGPTYREPEPDEIARRGKDLADKARAVASDSRVCSTSGEDPRKVRAEQTETEGMHKSYLILCDAERAKGFVKPYRASYKHRTCGAVTTMGRTIAETYARDPYFYGATFCVNCNVHRPLAEFTWLDGEPMDPHDPAWQEQKP